jgi:HEAT repeat protein
MPRTFYCEGCQQTHLIRDELVGRKIRCDCGRVQVASENAAQLPMPTKWLDSWPVLGSSCALLLVSLLVGGGVAAWVVLDRGTAENSPTPTVIASAPERAPVVAPPKDKEPPESRSKEKEHEKAEDNEKGRTRPPETVVARAPGTAPPPTYSEKELYKRLVGGRSVVWISHSDGKYVYTGTGSVIHRGRRLIITNQHVVQRTVEDGQGQEIGSEDVARVEVFFPQKGEGGEWITDKKYYESLRDRHQGIMGRVLRPTSADPDLALIQLEGDLPQESIALKFAPQPGGEGDKVVLVGNAGISSGLWSISPGFIKNRVPEVRVPRKFKSQDGEVFERDIIWKKTWCLETSIPSHQGDSGSPVVNDRGQLVGVHFGANPKSNLIKYAADRNEVLAYLKTFDVKPEEVVATDVLPPASAVVLDLIRLLDDMDLERCRKAVEDLSRLEPIEARRAVPALVRALQRHSDPTFRRRATEELERIGPPVKEDIDCLAQAMRIPYKPLRMYVLHALSQLGADAKPAMPVLAQGLNDRDNEVRQQSALVVKNLGPSARALTIRPLLRMAGDADDELASDGLTALVKLGPLTEDEIDALIETLNDGKRRIWVRRFAADSLGDPGPKAAKAVPALSKILRSETDLKLLMFSISSLRRIGDKGAEAGSALISVITSHPDEKIRMQALETLEALNLSHFPTGQMLECSITDKSEAMRNALASKLGVRLGELKPEQMGEMIPLFRHKEPAIILAGLKIVLMKKREAGPVSGELAYLVKHSDIKVRKKAVEALQAIGPSAKEAVPPLLEILKEVPTAQRPSVAVTIGMIEPKDPKVVEAVLPTLLAGLHPRTEKDGGPKPEQIIKVLTAMGQPAVNAIFKHFETLPYRGTDNINHRKNMFLALASLGPGCKCKENFEQVKSLRDRERFERYADVLAAAQQAMKEMDPN